MAITTKTWVLLRRHRARPSFRGGRSRCATRSPLGFVRSARSVGDSRRPTSASPGQSESRAWRVGMLLPSFHCSRLGPAVDRFCSAAKRVWSPSLRLLAHSGGLRRGGPSSRGWQSVVFKNVSIGVPQDYVS
jgi:hypothetical protein